MFMDTITQLQYQMNLIYALLPTGAKRIHQDMFVKEPDASWRPTDLLSLRSTKWPTLVLEVGWTEYLARLRYEAKWWLVHSRGEVNVAIVRVAEKSRTMSTPTHTSLLRRPYLLYRALRVLTPDALDQRVLRLAIEATDTAARTHVATTGEV
ncbi:hypothetical protein BO71DRAFT_424630 [Aspergillus ellipticus CBS 707.79]|uniref:Uncharacterized protein n=1 Tax=Aspergillus ellipticus CBS 707.79 TaxID=1448320 RepID=A0A319DQF6_9EURO|nr:hypothetical protein BO71DRAFT_424630 [Aspergillus ellipticus CBS 707.79]